MALRLCFDIAGATHVVSFAQVALTSAFFLGALLRMPGFFMHTPVVIGEH